MERQYQEQAAAFCNAIRELAQNEFALDNLESYLSQHFAAWLEKYANTPEWLARELKEFVSIEQ